MTEAGAIEAAARRLSLALDALEAAVERRREADRGHETLATQLHALDDDRAKLASDLDHAMARSKTLEVTNREVARRLDLAMETIRSVLEANDR